MFGLCSGSTTRIYFIMFETSELNELGMSSYFPIIIFLETNIMVSAMNGGSSWCQRWMEVARHTFHKGCNLVTICLIWNCICLTSKSRGSSNREFPGWTGLLILLNLRLLRFQNLLAWWFRFWLEICFEILSLCAKFSCHVRVSLLSISKWTSLKLNPH